MINAIESTSTRPYLIRALYEWCTDNGLTPYVAVQVDDSVQVPREYVKNGEIVLNISFDATSALSLGNELIEFTARFAGTPREIKVPIDRVTAVYARENGQGMAFPASPPSTKDEANIKTRPPATAVAPRTQLREAGQGNAGSEPNKVMHLVTGESATAESKLAELSRSNDALEIIPDPVDPPRPPIGGGSRPALKRIK
jgi:stringent starvation protein B